MHPRELRDQLLEIFKEEKSKIERQVRLRELEVDQRARVVEERENKLSELFRIQENLQHNLSATRMELATIHLKIEEIDQAHRDTAILLERLRWVEKQNLTLLETISLISEKPCYFRSDKIL